jgi:hypothetical protein
METTHITLDRGEAERLYRKYKEHKAYSSPIDAEVMRAYQLLAKGRLVIKALESIAKAGVNVEGLPKLAIAGATAKACYLERTVNGACTMASSDNWRAKKNVQTWRDDSFDFAPDTFPWGWDRKSRVHRSSHKATLPIIPARQLPRAVGGRMGARPAARPVPAAPHRQG